VGAGSRLPSFHRAACSQARRAAGHQPEDCGTPETGVELEMKGAEAMKAAQQAAWQGKAWIEAQMRGMRETIPQGSTRRTGTVCRTQVRQASSSGLPGGSTYRSKATIEALMSQLIVVVAERQDCLGVLSVFVPGNQVHTSIASTAAGTSTDQAAEGCHQGPAAQPSFQFEHGTADLAGTTVGSLTQDPAVPGSLPVRQQPAESAQSGTHLPHPTDSLPLSSSTSLSGKESTQMAQGVSSEENQA